MRAHGLDDTPGAEALVLSEVRFQGLKAVAFTVILRRRIRGSTRATHLPESGGWEAPRLGRAWMTMDLSPDAHERTPGAAIIRRLASNVV
jgi:hypothetical protein